MCERLWLFTGWFLLSYASEAAGDCPLPPHPKHGRHNPLVAACDGRPHERPVACNGTTGTLVPDNWLLTVQCNPGYQLRDPESADTPSVCTNGAWSIPLLPSCIPNEEASDGGWCIIPKAPPHSEVHLMDEECGDDLPPDSTVASNCILHFTCAAGFSQRPGSAQLFVCSNKTWVPSIPNDFCTRTGSEENTTAQPSRVTAPESLTPDDVPTEPAKVSCRLPEPPRFGAYTSIGCSRNDFRPACRNIPGTLVNNSWVLQYSCNRGYSLNNDYAFTVCVNGEWSSKFNCIKLCSPLISVSVDLKCSYKKNIVPCDRPMRPNTIVKAKCKHFYRQDILDSLNCLDNGEWSAPLFSCTPVCGVPGTPIPLVLHGNQTQQGQFPWLAALYYHNYGTKEWEQKCGGTLITPHIVLTAAHCLVENPTVNRVKPELMKVGLGKYFRDISNIEPYSVIVNVKEVVVHKKYKGGSSNYAMDIGLLDLVESVQVNAYVMPACVDWTNLFRPAPNAVGIVAGWGKTETGKSSEVILSAQLTYIGYARCFNMIRALYKKLLSHDKFCGKSDSSGGQVDRGDSGGGLTFLNENRQHLLIGIVSAEIPGEKTIRLFTDITNSEHSTWLEDETNRLKQRAHQGKEQVCLLPESSSNRKFCSLAAGCEDCDYYHKRCHLPPGSSADRVTVVCAPEYTIQGVQTNNKVVVCSAEGWSPTMHECLKQCPPPKSDSLQLTCQYDNKQVPCTKPALPDTTVTFKCLPGFSEYPDLKRGGSYRKHITCKKTGEWSGTFPPCKQDCGVSKGITSSNTTAENGNKDAKIGFFPWHAGLYYRRENDEGEISWVQMCGGSLISDRVVLTGTGRFGL